MTKKKNPASALDFSEERKAIFRLVERVYEESKYLRFRASESARDLVYPKTSFMISKLNKALNTINEVANAFNKKDK